MKTPGGMSKPIDFIGLKAEPQGTNQPSKPAQTANPAGLISQAKQAGHSSVVIV